MTALRDGVARLAARTEREIVAAYGRYERGQLSRSDFVALGSLILTRARARGVALADLTLAADVVRALRRRTSPLGLEVPDDDAARLESSVASVLDEEIGSVTTREQLAESRRARLARLGRDASAEAAVWAMRVGMIERGIRGWVRVTDVNPCRVCSNLADGVVRSPSVVMKRHTGCCCVQGAAFN